MYTPNFSGRYLKDRYKNNYSNKNDKIRKKISKIDWNSEWTYVDPDVFMVKTQFFRRLAKLHLHSHIIKIPRQ